ncbi:MAG: hydantoinase/oxoprolinase family protein [Chloroflexi bacterium]|nr:hydantoinase/oxoprolinase family protein [Chloroflexota bacterium]
MKAIGIDVGGTSTDAVLLHNRKVRRYVKTATTADVSSGISSALDALLGLAGPDAAGVDAVMLGTTHFTNAIVERRGLTPTAAIRIGLPATAFLEPFTDWPPDLTATVQARNFMVRGGHEYDGRSIVPFDAAAVESAAREIRDAGIRAVAITSVFSPLDATLEERAGQIVRRVCPGAGVTLSHCLGRIGLLPRENVTILNASLVDLARATTAAFADGLRMAGIDAPVYLTQNDGTIARMERAAELPILGVACGPTNSMRGAASLSGTSDALVIDVGGTTTDIGYLRHGLPRQANRVVEIGGVRTLFQMPDLLSLPLGGGSKVTAPPLAIGPESVGFRLTELGRVFGGGVTTGTDVAVAAGAASLGDPRLVGDLPDGLVSEAMAMVRAMLEDAVDRLRPDAEPRPVIAVGGAAFLVPDGLAGAGETVRVPHAAVANAVGAAMAQVSGESDRVYRDVPRDAAIAAATTAARTDAIAAGADPDTLEVVEVEDLPLAYLPGNSRRVRIKVLGEIALPRLRGGRRPRRHAPRAPG